MCKSSLANVATYRAETERSEWLSALFGLVETMAAWSARRRQRQALSELDDHILKDIGLTREQAQREAARPFWSHENFYGMAEKGCIASRFATKLRTQEEK